MKELYLLSEDKNLIAIANVADHQVAGFLDENIGYCELAGEVVEPIYCYRAVTGEIRLKDDWQQIKESVTEIDISVSNAD